MTETRPDRLHAQALRQMDKALAELHPPAVEGGFSGGGAGGGTTSSIGFAEIQSSIGTTPPFVYTVREVTPVGDGTFGAPFGDDFDLWNEDEIGIGGVGAAPVPDGAVVRFLRASATFTRSQYRGTY